MVPMSARSFLLYRRENLGNLKEIGKLSAGGILGVEGGSHLAFYLKGRVILFVFASFLLILSIFFPKEERKEVEKKPIPLLTFLSVGFLSGFMSAFLGIGGGAVLVPLQTKFLKVPLRHAIANSCGFIVIHAGVGVLRYFSLSPHKELFLPGIILALSALLTTPLGVKASGRIPPSLLRKIYSFFLLVVALLLFQKLLTPP
jgi:hypothetical protein